MKHTVRKYVDAYVIYEAQVEADSPEEASSIAYEAADELKWEPYDTVEFSACSCVALDANKEEIEETKRGKVL